MTVRFDTYEGKDLETLVYTDVISVVFDDNTWYITHRTSKNHVKSTNLDLEDYVITYIHI